MEIKEIRSVLLHIQNKDCYLIGEFEMEVTDKYLKNMLHLYLVERNVGYVEIRASVSLDKTEMLMVIESEENEDNHHNLN